MALALGEDGDQHVGAGHFLAAGGLDVDHRALDHALEAGGRLGIVASGLHQVFEFRIHILDEVAAELVEIDVAGPHDRSRVLIIHQREQQVLESRIFVVAFVRESQSAMERLFEAAGKCRHRHLYLVP